MSIGEIIDVISEKYEEYLRSTKTHPQNIKLPNWVYNALHMYRNLLGVSNTFDDSGETVLIMGMKAHPTDAIEDIEDIELF